MNRKWTIIAAVVVAALLMVGIVYAAQKSGGNSSANKAKNGQSQTSTSSAESSSSATSASGTPSGAAGSSSTKSGGTTTKGGTSSGSKSVTQKPQTPATLQTKPVPLPKVTAPPTKTVAMIDPKKYTANSKYSVTFVPYGTGPGTDSIVISISKSVPVGTVAKPYDFTGRNALVSMQGLSAKELVTKGGKYTGTLELVPQGGLLVPQLTSVAAAK